MKTESQLEPGHSGAGIARTGFEKQERLFSKKGLEDGESGTPIVLWW